MASAGITWPPVPPPAIKTRRRVLLLSRARQSISRVMFSSTPMLASVTNRDVPPKEMNGSVIPLVGSSATHDAHVEERLNQDRRGNAEGEEAREGIGREERRAQAAIAEDDEHAR